MIFGEWPEPLEWGCSRCHRDEQREIPGGGDPNAWERARRKKRGCDHESRQILTVIDGEPVRRCPWAALEGSPAVQLVTWFLEWQMLGLLPFGADRLSDCPAFVVQAFLVCAPVYEQRRMQVERDAVDTARKGALRKDRR